MLYFIIILITVVLVTAANLLFTIPIAPQEIGSVLFAVVFAVVAIIAVDGITALIIRRLTPKMWYTPGKRLFKVTKKERNFYRTLKIKTWKDKIPELGGFTSFHKDKLESNSDPAYLERFIIEANYGVVIHLVNAILGFAIMFIPFCASPTIWIPVFLVNFILSILPVAILRYTSHTLQNLYNRCKKKENAQRKETV